MRRLLSIGLLAFVAAAFAPLTRATAIPIPDPRPLLREALDQEPAEDCTELEPAAAHVPGVDGEGHVSIEVQLVADRDITLDRARALLARASSAYAPLNMSLVEVGSAVVSFTGVDTQSIINQAKALYGGVRPLGTDIVLVVTSVDLTAPGIGAAALGQADCLGGVRYPNRSFAVVEDATKTLLVEEGDAGFNIGPLNFYSEATAKAVAHEFGHLFGAHHHYANCGETADIAVNESKGDVCTLMTSSVDFMGFRFGAFEGLVIRGHAEIWSAP